MTKLMVPKTVDVDTMYQANILIAIDMAAMVSYSIEDQGWTGQVYCHPQMEDKQPTVFVGGGDDTGETKPAFDAFHEHFERLIEGGWKPRDIIVGECSVECHFYPPSFNQPWMNLGIEVTDTLVEGVDY